MNPFAIISDLHLHSWQAFSKVDEDGINTRLSDLLMEVVRCSWELAKAGGDTIYIAGDIFHVRGSISPSVLNPTLDTFKVLTETGTKIRVIPGNHDLEGKNSTRLGSAITSLESVGVEVCHKVTCFSDDMVIAVPWFDDLNDLRAQLENIDPRRRSEYTVLIHAPVDGVITGLPEHGLTSGYLHSLGFKRVFLGHYHHHKDFGNGVCSIGALAHHTWSDVGSKAGFLIVDESIRWLKSHLPEFIDVTGEADEAEIMILAEGNYIRCKTFSTKMSDIENLRSELVSAGAKGVVIQSIKVPVAEREGTVASSVRAGASLEESVAEYVERQCFPDAERVLLECQKVFSEAGCA